MDGASTDPRLPPGQIVPASRSPSNPAWLTANRQQNAERAIREGVFEDEIVPIEVAEKRGIRVVGNDEHPRPGTTVEALAKLRAAVRASTSGR